MTINLRHYLRFHCRYTKEKVAKMAAVVQAKIKHFNAAPTVGIICGSGLGKNILYPV